MQVDCDGFRKYIYLVSIFLRDNQFLIYFSHFTQEFINVLFENKGRLREWVSAVCQHQHWKVHIGLGNIIYSRIFCWVNCLKIVGELILLGVFDIFVDAHLAENLRDQSLRQHHIFLKLRLKFPFENGICKFSNQWKCLDFFLSRK
jgi:hypothetical protein